MTSVSACIRDHWQKKRTDTVLRNSLNCKLPGVEIVVLCPDLWGQCTPHPAAGSMGYWQLTAAALTVHFPAQGHSLGYDPSWGATHDQWQTDARIQRSGPIVSTWDNSEEPFQLQNSQEDQLRFQLQPRCGLASPSAHSGFLTSLLMCLPKALSKRPASHSPP